MPYADTAFADAFHGARISGEQWAGLSPDKQAAALQSASDALDLYAAERGGWKQDYTANPPEPIRRACCLEALALTDETTQERVTAQRQGVTSTSIGSASESYSAQTGAGAALSNTLVAAMLRPFLRHAGGGVVII